MTRMGFLSLDWRGEGVVGPGLELGLGLGLDLGFLGTESGTVLGLCLERVGEGDDVVLEKNEVIWRCGLTSGDRPLLWRRDGAIAVNQSLCVLARVRERERCKGSEGNTALDIELRVCGWRETHGKFPGKGFGSGNVVWRESCESVSFASPIPSFFSFLLFI